MFKENERGLTLVEILVSIALLGIIAISIIPMFTMAIKNSRSNSTKLTALNLAYNQVEWIKSLEYDDEIGLNETGYPVGGIIDRKLYMNEPNSNPLTIEGVEYRVTTSIYWDSAVSSISKEPVPKARKKIDVYVEAYSPFSKKTMEYSVLNTIISFEGERSPSEPGHMNVYVYYQTTTSEPLKNVKIEVSGASNQVAYTDNEGKATIVDLKEGNYGVEPTRYAKASEMIVMPNRVNNENLGNSWYVKKNMSVPKWDKKNPPIYPSHIFFMDYPARIIFPENNSYPNINISIYPDIGSGTYSLEDGMNISDITLKSSLSSIKDVKFWRLWQYNWDDLKYKEGSYTHRFYLLDDDDTEWDGTFDRNVEESINKNLRLSFGLSSEGIIRKNGGRDEVIVDLTSKLKNISDINELEIEMKKGDEGDWKTVPKFVVENGVSQSTYEIIYDSNTSKLTIRFKERFSLSSFGIDMNENLKFRLDEEKISGENKLKNIYDMDFNIDRRNVVNLKR